MGLLNGFNADEHESQSREPIPAGVYEVVLTKAEMKPPKSGLGLGIECEFEVIEGDHVGRKVFTWINYQHSNETAQKIGKAQLADICRAVAVLQPESTDELLNIPLLIDVVVEQRKDNGEMSNRVKKFKAKLGGLVAKPDAGQPASQSGAAGASPWRK